MSDSKPRSLRFQGRSLATGVLTVALALLFTLLNVHDFNAPVLQRKPVAKPVVVAAKLENKSAGDGKVPEPSPSAEQLRELSRRYKSESDAKSHKETLTGLLDYYLFKKNRLVGMSKAEVDDIFGPVASKDSRTEDVDGRDFVYIEFENEKVKTAKLVMGF